MQQFARTLNKGPFLELGKKVRSELIEKLKQEGELSPKGTYICERCIKHAEARIVPKRKKNTIVAEMVQNIENGVIEEDELEMIMCAIGRRESLKVFDDSLVAGSIYKKDDMLKHFDPARYMSERNGPLLAFFKGLMQEGDFYQKEKAVVISSAVDSVYYLVNTKFVAPLAFAKSLLIYTKTGSKEGVNVASAASPSGSYTSILNWLKANSQEKIKIPDNSDVISFFDNNQVIGRKWRVKNDFKAESSVITSVAHMQPRSDIQRNIELAPSKWQSFHVQAKKDSLEKLKAQEILFEKEFSKLR
ncbi:uncharacterized protein LOC134251838 [Saccostrea cucullata]|uniref:uncharacterized protein LOC134251838 n=1 Tax=Saccostrea cuccullata TaxID=36930 RepID=UPI002ED14CC1